MKLLTDIPIELRLVVLGVLGAMIGSAVNLAVYQLAWNRRAISPWLAADAKAPPRKWTDRIPVAGWFGLRREASLHGTGFWIRPLVVEVVAVVGLAALYWWEVDQRGLIRPLTAPPSDLALHVQFLVHAFLMTLMLAGSLIDADEKTIPDAITVPGTLLGLIVMAAFPMAMLPDIARAVGQAPQYVTDFLRLTAPNPWPDWLGPAPWTTSLAIAIGCWWGWCFALMPRTWYGRHGCCRAIGLSLARMRREPSTYWIGAAGVAGALMIAGVWKLGGDHWEGLLTALVGLAAGGGIIWSVRIIGTVALRREAMGFGDVTLMAMIGVYLGWQSCLVIFFLAPFAGLVAGLFSLALHREPEIPYGPFLCMATAFVLIRWEAVWQWGEPLFMLGLIVPAIFAVGLVFMAGMLWLYHALFG